MISRFSRRHFIPTILTLCALIAPLANAQQDDPAAQQHVRASRGLPLSQARYSTLHDARSITLNPASLGLLERADIHYMFATSEIFGEGHGLFLATPLIGSLSMGAGVEWTRAPGSTQSYRRYRFGLGVNLLERLAFGVRYSGFGSEEDRHIDALHSVDLGMQLRLIDRLAASFSAEHVNTPRLNGEWIDPVFRVGLGWSGWDGRLHLDTSYVVPSADSDDIGVFQGVISVDPLEGLGVFAQARGGDDPTRFGGGLEAQLGPFGLAGAAYANVDEGGAIGFDGFTASFRVIYPTTPSLFQIDDRWITLDLPASLSERSPRSPFGIAGASFTQLLVKLDAIVDDASVRGVVLHIDGLAFGFGQLYELHTVITRMRRNGKTVVAHLRDTSTRSYYLASAAEHIYLAPARNFSPRGLAISLSYYNHALARFGIRPEFVKIDRYKSAPEAYTRTEPSAESAEQINAYLDALHGESLLAISNARGITIDAAAAAIDEAPMRASRALELGLIDGISYRDELAEVLQRDLELPMPPLLREDYSPPPRYPEGWDVPHRIAVVYIDGTIADGSNIEVPLTGSLITGARSIAEAMELASSDPSVVAIVLRINSPGGSATGSDTMHRAISKAAERKPVIVSMGNIATSGGYYAAVGGDHIFASPTTLTGSIGIFFGKVNLSGLYQLLMVYRHTFKRGRFADIFSLDRGWEEIERAKTYDLIESLYEVFLERVAAGRNMSRDEVHAVAEGRIWAGEKAREVGLIDQNGGLLDAIAEAKRRGGLDADAPVRLVELPPRSIWSALTPTLPLLPSLETEAAPASPPRSDRAAAMEALVAGFIDRLGGMPTVLIFEPDEPLMLLPFDWHIED